MAVRWLEHKKKLKLFLFNHQKEELVPSLQVPWIRFSLKSLPSEDRCLEMGNNCRNGRHKKILPSDMVVQTEKINMEISLFSIQ